ncbi:hypothetical protein J3458_001853 [Metarhizium acridum]|uniref:Uncharacterized protein n=1 Tax=Metarhizium acridum (strain CQMa 102) TaxID=655827 RepID=E9DUQ6_METAQ|nr:uncharacterized protein MAC_01354 [Metarhizium acridum CQMa 102]EFY92718.1 hypothetical protein MAC_01354 [Metarhizium acridum CQMa 102]KAG8425118.1 hypothetical protein J3458_001853 [Metarhizium acridum]
MDGRTRAPARSRKRQRSNSPAAGPSKRANTTNNHNTGGDEDSDSVIEVRVEESEEEGEDKYAVREQRFAVRRERDADSLTCNFCLNLELSSKGKAPACNRQIIDGLVHECQTCADHRYQSGDLDHQCFRTGQHPDLQVFKRHSNFHPVNYPKPITCEECKDNRKVKNSRCDADPFLQLRCTNCMKTKDSESKLCLVKASTGDADLGWGYEVERQMGPKPNLQKGRRRWFRRECDICKSKPDKEKGQVCSWLDSRQTGEPGDVREPCLQCKEGKMSCFDGGMLVGHPDSLEVPTEWSTRGDLGGGWVELRGDKGVVTRPQCKQCHAQKRHCRASAKHAEYACNWCWQTGMVCRDLNDENKIYPLFDLSRVGIGNFCPFARCGRCEATGRNCDRQRPCDSCFFNGEGDMCDKWHAGALRTLNCLNRRINHGENMMVKPGPLYYLSMGYGPEGVDDEKDGTQIEHYVGPPFARYAFKTVPDRPGDVLEQNKQALVAEMQRMRSALVARGVPPHGAPGGELDGMNVNDITLDQLRTWLVRRWPSWTRQCDRKEYAKHRDFKIVSKAYIRSKLMEASGGSPNTTTLVEELGDGEEDLQTMPVTESTSNITSEGDRTGIGAVDAYMVSTVSTAPNVANNATFMTIPSNLLSGGIPLRLTLPNSEDYHEYHDNSLNVYDIQSARWREFLSQTRPPCEKAIWQDYYQNPTGSTDFGLFSVMNGSLVRHSPINQVFRGISSDSVNVQLQRFPCIEQRQMCTGLTERLCQDIEHGNLPHSVCESCVRYDNGLLSQSPGRMTKFDIVAMRAYFCNSCHSRVIGGSLTDLYLLGAKNVWGCRFTNNATIGGSVAVNGRNMNLFPFEHPITGCTCGFHIFNSHLCLPDRIKYARYALYQSNRMREWRVAEEEKDLCPVCLVHHPKDVATASPSYHELLSADGTSTEETVSWACLVCGGLVLNQPKKNAIIGGWFNWFPTAVVSDWGIDHAASF